MARYRKKRSYRRQANTGRRRRVRVRARGRKRLRQPRAGKIGFRM